MILVEEEDDLSILKKQDFQDSGHKWERVTAEENKCIEQYLNFSPQIPFIYANSLSLRFDEVQENAVCCFSGIRKLGLLKQLNVTIGNSFPASYQPNSELQILLEKIGEQIGMMRVLNTLNLHLKVLTYSSSFLSPLKNIPNLTSFQLLRSQSFFILTSKDEEQNLMNITKQLCDELTIVSQCNKLAVLQYDFPFGDKQKYVLNEEIKSTLDLLKHSQSLQQVEINNNSNDIDTDIYKEMGITFSQINTLQHFRIFISNQLNQENFGNGLFELIKSLSNSKSINHLEIATKDDFSLLINRFSDTLLEVRNFNNLTILKLEISSLSEVYLVEQEKLNENIGNNRQELFGKIMEELLSPIGNLSNLRTLSLEFSSIPILQSFSFLIHLQSLNNLEVGTTQKYYLMELFQQRNRENINSFVNTLGQLKSLYYLSTHFDNQMKQQFLCKIATLISLKEFSSNKLNNVLNQVNQIQFNV